MSATTQTQGVPMKDLWPRVEAPQAQRSPSLEHLATALAKAQAKIETASKDANNTHFGSRYADLASVWSACREALTSEGLSVVQLPCGEGERVGLTTMLLHASGQWMSSTIYATPDRKGPQAVGSVLTYLRRYSLAAAVGVAPDDDDGEAATDRAPAPSNDNGRRIATQPRTASVQSSPGAQAASPAPSSSEKMASLQQMRKYHALRESMGVSEDEGRERVSKLLARAVTSMTDVTMPEMIRVLDKMEAAQNGAA